MSIAQISLPTTAIRQHAHARKIDERAVVSLAESINAIGLKTPITVRKTRIFINCIEQDGYEVVSGQHRLEAVKMLGLEEIECFVTEDDETACRMWEISENLHRAELSELEKNKLIDEWRRLTGVKVRQVAAPLGGVQPRDDGIRETARQLGIDEREVRRARQLSSLSEEAQKTACDLGLNNNKSAMLRAAKESSPKKQVDMLVQHAAQLSGRRSERKPLPTSKTVDEVEDEMAARIVKEWNRAGKGSRLIVMHQIWQDWKDLEMEIER